MFAFLSNFVKFEHKYFCYFILVKSDYFLLQNTLLLFSLAVINQNWPTRSYFWHLQFSIHHFSLVFTLNTFLVRFLKSRKCSFVKIYNKLLGANKGHLFDHSPVINSSCQAHEAFGHQHIFAISSLPLSYHARTFHAFEKHIS